MNKASVPEPLRQVGRGFLMGCADVVPGVSGGTVALILRIYDRLITALSRFDRTLISLLSRGQLAAALKHVDFGFLAALGIGVLTGFVAMTLLVGKLFAHDLSRSMTLATFFGMILATGFLVARMTFRRPDRTVPDDAAGDSTLPLVMTLVVAGGALSYWLASLDKSHKMDPSLGYLFICGSIAICAMILPGISGAVILWILGVYRYVTAIPRQLIDRQNIASNLVEFSVFCLGCLIGLLAFSKLLKFLLRDHRQSTLAVLCGFIFGALRALWPFQGDLTPALSVRHKEFEPFLPAWSEDSVLLVVLAGLAGLIAVLAADWLSQRAHAVTGPQSGVASSENSTAD